MAAQQLTGALTSLQFQPSVFSFNLDFAVYKAAPPAEYGAVGKQLSPLRCENAEAGPMHSLAQKIGWLFARQVPPIPTIVSTYGRRASEISTWAAVTKPTRKRWGVFSQNIGADATSLWASITAGPGLIAVHLLACMLARIWKDDDVVTAIWMEIIDNRRRQIAKDVNLETDIFTIEAARSEITREHVAIWHASARAWLEAADQAMGERQQKIDLVMKEMGCSVNDDSNTYTNVLAAWENSLVQIEGLLQGVSQRAMRGDVLLALSSWHLYPDFDILRPKRMTVIQNDPLVPRGSILTIGLEVPCNPGRGVYWSLPLKHLRPYGPPISCDSELDLGRSRRPSRDDLMMAMLGCYFKSWGRYANETQLAVEWMSWLGDVLYEVAEERSSAAKKARALLGPQQQASWLFILVEAAQRYTESKGTPKDYAWHMLREGQELSGPFIAPAAQPFFNLLDPVNLLRILKTEDDRVDYLRQIAKEIQRKYMAHPKDFIIRYRRGRHYEYASGIPCEGPIEDQDNGYERHYRILYGGLALPNESSRTYWDCCEKIHRRKNRSTLHHNNAYRRMPLPMGDGQKLEEAYHWRKQRYRDKDEMVLRLETHPVDDLFPSLAVGGSRSGWFGSPRKDKFAMYEFVYGDPDLAALYYGGSNAPTTVLEYPLLNTRLLYAFTRRDDRIDRTNVVRYLYDHLVDSAKDKHFASLRAAATAANVYKMMPDATMDIRVLKRSLSTAHWVHETGNEEVRQLDWRPPTPGRSRSPSPSPHAFNNLAFRPRSASPRTSSRPPSRAQSPVQWRRIRLDDDSAPETPVNLRLYSLTTMQVFACVLMFESGRFDLHPYELRSVMAISSGSSLFVGALLLCDPWDQPSSTEIRHIAGNIGRPGIAALVPPAEPMVQSPEDMAEVGRFGRPEQRTETFTAVDKFDDTTLHLEFTGVDQPFDSAPQLRSQLYRLETLVRVYDRGDWIADLDVYRHLEESAFTKASQSFYITPPPSRRTSSKLTYTVTRLPECPGHDEEASGTKKNKGRRGSYATSDLDAVLPAAMFQRLESWYEILRASQLHINVVCAHGNWEARLAAAAVCRALGYKTYIVPHRVCWACAELAGAVGGDKKVVLI